MRGSSARALLPGLVVLALLGVVAVAATGSTQRGSDETRRPSDIVLDTFFSFALLALVPAAALLVYGLMQRKAIAQEMASGRYKRSGILTFFVVCCLLGAFWYFVVPRRRNLFFEQEDETQELEILRPRPEQAEGDTYEPELAWIPILIVLGLAAIGIGFWMLAARRRARAFDPARDQLVEDVADVLDESLDDLRAEPDARRAVIAAYARLERTFAAAGHARLRQETAEEHVGRLLGKLEVDDRLVRRLTDLFARAKFSHHVVDETMKEEAISALAQIRDELRAAARKRAEELMRVLEERAAAS